MKRRKISIFILLTSISIAACIFAFFNSSDKNSYMDKLNKTQTGSAMWARSARTIDDLIDLSEIIIEGKVINYEPFEEDNIIMTKETIEIKKVLKGDVSEGDNIIVTVTGGELNGKITSPIKDCPIIDMRGNYMLFLEKNDAGSYCIVAGNQGFGLIKNNKIEVTAKNSLADKIKEYGVNNLEGLVEDKNELQEIK